MHFGRLAVVDFTCVRVVGEKFEDQGVQGRKQN